MARAIGKLIKDRKFDEARDEIRQALHEAAGNFCEASRSLGMRRITLHRNLKRLGMYEEASKYMDWYDSRFRLPEVS